MIWCLCLVRSQTTHEPTATHPMGHHHSHDARWHDDTDHHEAAHAAEASRSLSHTFTPPGTLKRARTRPRSFGRHTSIERERELSAGSSTSRLATTHGSSSSRSLASTIEHSSSHMSSSVSTSSLVSHHTKDSPLISPPRLKLLRRFRARLAGGSRAKAGAVGRRNSDPAYDDHSARKRKPASRHRRTAKADSAALLVERRVREYGEESAATPKWMGALAVVVHFWQTVVDRNPDERNRAVVGVLALFGVLVATVLLVSCRCTSWARCSSILSELLSLCVLGIFPIPNAMMGQSIPILVHRATQYCS